MAADKSKKRLFLIAIASSGHKNVAAFAKRLGVSQVAVHRVLSGQSTSKKISAAIDRLINTELSKLCNRKAA